MILLFKKSSNVINAGSVGCFKQIQFIFGGGIDFAWPNVVTTNLFSNYFMNWVPVFEARVYREGSKCGRITKTSLKIQTT